MTKQDLSSALLGAIAVSAALTIAADLGGPAWWRFAFKPLTTLLLIAWAWPRGADRPAQRRWARVGLVASLAGDVALLWPEQGFLPGLVAFLLAHLAYIGAFTRGVRLAARPGPFLGYAAVAAAVLSQLWPGVPAGLRVPVLAYVAALACMAAQAAVWWLTRRGGSAPDLAWRAAAGGALFMASDAVLAANRFLAPVPAAGLWILASYWLAQLAIAGALRPDARSEARPSPTHA
jgi:uncharacterized membrane protein YhhN